MQHTKPGVADRLVNDVREIAEKLIKEPWKKAAGAVLILYYRICLMNQFSLHEELIVLI